MIVSLSPNTGTGTTVTFKAVFADPNGATDLSELLLQINAAQSGANACYVYYQPFRKSFVSRHQCRRMDRKHP
jgi:hypothetical protein